MFTSFTGNARRPRQVNLSGRNTKASPALSGVRQSPSAPNSSSPLAHAQAERIWRQQERLRPPAATTIQRSWRGHRGRKQVKDAWRREWDTSESIDLGEESVALPPLEETLSPYHSEESCLNQLRLLVHFASARNPQDIHRLCRFARRYLASFHVMAVIFTSDVWTYPLLRLAKLIMTVLKYQTHPPELPQCDSLLLRLLTSLASAIPYQLLTYSSNYFDALAEILVASRRKGVLEEDVRQALGTAVLALLQSDSTNIVVVYEGFVRNFLQVSDIPGLLNGLEVLAHGVAYEPLCTAVSNLLSASGPDNILECRSHNELLWLLSYFIYFRRSSRAQQNRSDETPDPSFVEVVSKLISYLADEIGSRIDASGTSALASNTASATQQSSPDPLPNFVREEILTLISQENVSSLLTHVESRADSNDTAVDAFQIHTHRASSLAIYALTLLRAFPRRGDEIRMWLYLGSTSKVRRSKDHQSTTLPAIKYYFQAAAQTSIYSLIKSDPRRAVDLLSPDTSRRQPGNTAVPHLNEQWQVILLFLELYPIVLKVMDDEEFLTGASSLSQTQSWTRQSALSLESVKDLTVFLKNLAFSMYWNASEIAGIEAVESTSSIADYFRGNLGAISESHKDTKSTKSADNTIAGVPGMTGGYLKSMVTGLLRMIYERDSRRKFLPSDHWLMTQWFEMDRFIPAVVQEEEEKHKIQESYGEDPDDDQTDDEERHENLVGTQRTQQVRNVERLKRQQRKASRRRYLESVTPRLEILQNMPFFIPFGTRVQIFRRFVSLDQLRRRGTADPEMWRFTMANSSHGDMGKHRARVHRESIFDDAYDQYYDLGEALKEPIQISFVDKFDTVEEGIDGGGVTKEFLTSITNEAFNPKSGLDMFIENDQHLLYPNPMALDERKEILRQADIPEGSIEWNKNVRDLLRRFEFLGRVIGKCLYEGILVDIHFAGFFLLKWALTGGSGSATKESGYRANLNDLRDLDEGLYQGLVSSSCCNDRP